MQLPIERYSIMGNKPNYPQIRQEAISRRNAQLDKHTPALQRILTDSRFTTSEQERITRLTLTALVAALNKHEVTSLQLVAVFGLRAATIGKALCIITEDYFEYALARAEECDNIRRKSGKNNWTLEEEWDMEKFLPPLFGVPISLKDNIELAGTTSTVGLSCRANRIVEQDDILAKAIKNAGMIPFVKTNLPQLAMCFDTNNFLWGRALNPWNQKKSVGGSSGGEGGAVAARISPIGVGNDIGGSLRIPAAFCGISALLSAQGRLPLMGTCTSYCKGFSGMDLIKVVSGPMGTSIDGLALWMCSMTDIRSYQGEYDPYIKLHRFDVPLYRAVATQRQKLKIGYFRHLEMIESTPASQRAVNEVVEFLRKEGHELEEIEVPNEREIITCFMREVSGEGGLETFHDMLEGEELVGEYKQFNQITGMNTLLYKLVKFLVSRKHPRIGLLVETARPLSTHEYLVNAGRAHELKAEWIQYWRKQKLDFVICPGVASEATNHGLSNDAVLLAAFTFIWNVLAMSSCSLPITVVREDEQHYDSHWEDDITNAIKGSVVDAANLPVNVQVVGLPFEEERVLGLSKRIEEHFQFYQKHPLPSI